MARGTCQRATPCKKSVDRAAGLTNGRIGLKLCGKMATIRGQTRLGMRWWHPLSTCHRHVPIYFIISLIAPEWLARSGPKRCHSTQFNDRSIAKSIASFSVPCATCQCFYYFASCAQTAERILFGHTLFGQERRQQYYEVDCSMFCTTWHVPIACGT